MEINLYHILINVMFNCCISQVLYNNVRVQTMKKNRSGRNSPRGGLFQQDSGELLEKLDGIKQGKRVAPVVKGINGEG